MARDLEVNPTCVQDSHTFRSAIVMCEKIKTNDNWWTHNSQFLTGVPHVYLPKEEIIMLASAVQIRPTTLKTSCTLWHTIIYTFLKRLGELLNGGAASHRRWWELHCIATFWCLICEITCLLLGKNTCPGDVYGYPSPTKCNRTRWRW